MARSSLPAFCPYTFASFADTLAHFGAQQRLPDAKSLEVAVDMRHALANRKGVSYADLETQCGVTSLCLQPVCLHCSHRCRLPRDLAGKPTSG